VDSCAPARKSVSNCTFPTPISKTGFLESRSEPLEEPATCEAKQYAMDNNDSSSDHPDMLLILPSSDPSFHDFSQSHCYSKHQTFSVSKLHGDSWLAMYTVPFYLTQLKVKLSCYTTQAPRGRGNNIAPTHY
jgi:hypothetical protein